MKAIISWWDLSASNQTIDTLCEYLRNEGVEPWSNINELLLKFWISDRKTNRWGAVTLWQSEVVPAASLPPNRATELIGYPPTDRMATDIEAIVGSINFEHPVNQILAFKPEDSLR